MRRVLSPVTPPTVRPADRPEFLTGELVDVMTAGGIPNVRTGLAFYGTSNANILYACPFLLARRLTYDQIGIRWTATTAAGTERFRTGIYSNTSSRAPGTLLVDSGEYNVASTGSKTTVTTGTLAEGWYWLAWVSNMNLSSADRPLCCAMAAATSTNPCVALGTTSDTTEPANGISVAFAYAALPATWPGGHTGNRTNTLPSTYLRVA